MSTKSDYNYKTDFDIWRENKQFECQNITRSQPPLDLTHVGAKTSGAKIPAMKLTPIGAKMSDPKTPTMDSSVCKEKREKSAYQRIRSQTKVSQTRPRENLIRPTTVIIKEKGTIKIKALETQETGLHRLIVKRL